MFRKKLIIAIVVFATASFSGCVGGQSGQTEGPVPPDDPSGGIPSDGNTSAPPSTQPQDVVLNTTVVLEGCDYWQGFLYLPPGANPGRPPSGFSEPDQPLATRIQTIRFDCDRLAIRDLDRGPVSLLLELHSNVEPLEECRVRVNGMSYWVAQTLLVSDADTVNRTQDLGLTTYEASIASMAPTPDGAELMEDQWSVNGHPTSQVRVVRDNNLNRFDNAPMRLFWHDGQSLWVGDLQLNGAGSAMVSRGMVGSVASPLLMAQVTDHVAMVSSWYADGGATLKVQQYPSGTCDA